MATRGYSEALDLPEPEVRERLARDLGYVSAKVGTDAAIFDADDRILLVHRADDHRWGLVSGWVDPGESPANTVVREVKEEVGLDATIIELADAIGRPAANRSGPHALVAIVYLCTVAPGPIVISHESLAAEYREIKSVKDWHANHESLAYLARDAWRARRV